MNIPGQMSLHIQDDAKPNEHPIENFTRKEPRFPN